MEKSLLQEFSNLSFVFLHPTSALVPKTLLLRFKYGLISKLSKYLFCEANLYNHHTPTYPHPETVSLTPPFTPAESP
jgi:hypothetical protein